MFPDDPFQFGEFAGAFGPPNRDPDDYLGTVDLAPGLQADLFAPVEFVDLHFEDLDFSGFAEVVPALPEPEFDFGELPEVALEEEWLEYFLAEADFDASGDWRGPFQTREELIDWLTATGLWPLVEEAIEDESGYYVELAESTP